MDAKTYEEAGFDGIIVENFGDSPFSKTLPREVIPAFTVVAKAVKKEVSLPLGINALRNDCIVAYSIAHAVGGSFIRVNVLTGVAFTDQGIIEGCARELWNVKRIIGGDILTLADVHVKHAVHFTNFEDAVKDTVERGLADGIIVTGRRTGESISLEDLILAKRVSSIPVLVGSGVNPRNFRTLFKYADGFIVGTWVKENGKINNPVSLERAKILVRMKNSLMGV